MRDDINLLNLMNGMNYSVHQLAHLMEYAKRAEEARKEGQEERLCDTEDAVRYRNLLQSIVGTLERGGMPPKETLQTAWKLRGEVARGRPKPGARAGKDPNEALARLCAQTKEVLFESQRQVIVDYKPCLIPPKNLKDPVRVGQANDTGPMLRILQNLRSLPEKRWAERRDEMIERTLARIEAQEGKFPEGEREKKKEAMAGLLDRARSMGDFDFELQKDELAKEFEQFCRKEAIEKELKDLAGEDAVLDGKIRSILLHPRAAALYEVRLAQVKAATAGKRVDLDKISPADHCKNGGCAIKEK